MSLRKLCSGRVAPRLADGRANPLYCALSPRCDHHWHYDFRVNRRRYRASTETADKQKAKDIEARERSRVLDGRHGIRRQPDVTFREFAREYLRLHAEPYKRSVARDREIIATLNAAFGDVLLRDLTELRIKGWIRDRLAGKWRGHQTTGTPKPIQPSTVNRELDTLRSILSKAVAWKKLLEHPMAGVPRLQVQNTRTRILTPDEQRRLLGACPRKLRAVVTLALITGARVGELLALRWEDCQDGSVTFLETKNGQARRIPLTPAIAAVLASQARVHPWVFTNTRRTPPRPFRSMRQVFDRAVARAGIATGDVTLHTLRHTALSRMIAEGYDDYTVMAISGHSSTRMLARYTHPTEARKAGALALGADVVKNGSTSAGADPAGAAAPDEIAQLLKESGGRQEARTPDLRVANASGQPSQPAEPPNLPRRKRP